MARFVGVAGPQKIVIGEIMWTCDMGKGPVQCLITNRGGPTTVKVGEQEVFVPAEAHSALFIMFAQSTDAWAAAEQKLVEEAVKATNMTVELVKPEGAVE